MCREAHAVSRQHCYPSPQRVRDQPHPCPRPRGHTRPAAGIPVAVTTGTTTPHVWQRRPRSGGGKHTAGLSAGRLTGPSTARRPSHGATGAVDVPSGGIHGAGVGPGATRWLHPHRALQAAVMAPALTQRQCLRL